MKTNATVRKSSISSPLEVDERSKEEKVLSKNTQFSWWMQKNRNISELSTKIEMGKVLQNPDRKMCKKKKYNALRTLTWDLYPADRSTLFLYFSKFHLETLLFENRKLIIFNNFTQSC